MTGQHQHLLDLLGPEISISDGWSLKSTFSRTNLQQRLFMSRSAVTPNRTLSSLILSPVSMLSNQGGDMQEGSQSSRSKLQMENQVSEQLGDQRIISPRDGQRPQQQAQYIVLHYIHLHFHIHFLGARWENTIPPLPICPSKLSSSLRVWPRSPVHLNSISTVIVMQTHSSAVNKILSIQDVKFLGHKGKVTC